MTARTVHEREGARARWPCCNGSNERGSECNRDLEHHSGLLSDFVESDWWIVSVL